MTPEGSLSTSNEMMWSINKHALLFSDSSGAHYGQPACLHAIPDNGKLSNQPRRLPIVRNIIRNMPEEREKGWEAGDSCCVEAVNF